MRREITSKRRVINREVSQDNRLLLAYGDNIGCQGTLPKDARSGPRGRAMDLHAALHAVNLDRLIDRLQANWRRRDKRKQSHNAEHGSKPGQKADFTVAR